MARNGSGAYSLPAGNPVVTGTVISSTTMNSTLSDIATALTASIANDGQTVPVANIPMGGFKLTGLGAATVNGDAVRYQEAVLAGADAKITSMTGLTAPTVAANPVRATDLQVQLVTAFTTGGSSTAYTLTPAPAITANTAGQRFFVTFNAAAGATPTLAVSGQTAKSLKYRDSTGAKQAVTSTQIPINWSSDVEFDGTDWVVLNVPPAAASTTVSSIAGLTRNAKMSVTTASATGTFTADEVIVETALGGTPLQLSSYSQAINLATTGAGGMDTGAAPATGFVSIYAIAKSDGTKGILACNVTTSSGAIYGGANMPAGYSYSGLIGIWPTNGSSQFVAGLIMDPQGRKFQYQTYSSIFTAHAAIATLTSQSISGAVPAAARTADVVMGGTNTATFYNLGVSGDATGTGGKAGTAASGGATATQPGGMTAMTIALTMPDVPLITAQTIYVIGNTANLCCYVSGFGW